MIDFTTREARKILRDYYTWYWDEYYERSWADMRENMGRLFGMDLSKMNAHDAMNKVFGYEDAKPYHDKIDHTLDIKRGVDKGILIAPYTRGHNDLLKELSEVQESLDLNDLVNGFMHSLSTGKNHYRTALASYFFARSMPKHEACRDHVYGLQMDNEACPVCGMRLDEKYICHVEDSFSRYILYFPNNDTVKDIQTPEYALFDLKQFKDLPKVSYTKEDVDILVKILKVIESMADHNNYSAVQKLITRAKMVPASGGEINVILGVLSVCGVLQTPEHKGYNERFTAWSDKGFVGMETELFYPLFHWRGRNGINKIALAEIFPSCVIEQLNADTKEVSLTEVYAKSKKEQSVDNRAKAAFPDDKHIIELDDKRRYFLGLTRLDPSWHKEVRYSVLYAEHRRMEIYFDGNTIRKIICESRKLLEDGTFSVGSYVEKDLLAETEDRYLLLPKTSRGKKKPWTPSLLDVPTYTGATFYAYLNGNRFYTHNIKTNDTLPWLNLFTYPEPEIKTPIAFYTYLDELIKRIPVEYEDYEDRINKYLNG